jgi:hypothetical protein
MLELTNAVCARMLTVALCPQLIALVAGTADAPANRPRNSSGAWSWCVGMLPLLVLRAAAGHVRIVNADVLLKLLLEGIPLGHVVHAGRGKAVSRMPLGNMTIGVES